MSRIKILDGGIGRELKRMGAPFRQPEWSALSLMEAPHFVTAAHDNYISSGAQIITTNSYAIVPFHIGLELFDSRGLELSQLASRLARDSAAEASRPVLVAGSLPPAMGSYRPDLFVEDESVRIHKVLVEGMKSDVDFWLAETQSSIAEIVAAKRSIDEVGDSKPFWVAFTLEDDPDVALEKSVLRSGEPVFDAVTVALSLGAVAVLFNCSQPEVMEAGIAAARAAIEAFGAANVELGIYANAFPPQSKKATANAVLLDIREDLTPANYALWAQKWAECGATVVGECCGIGCDHIKEISQAMKK